MNKEEYNIGLKYLSKRDKVLRTIIKKYSIRNLTPRRKYFNVLLRSIIGQQLSVKAAQSIYNRFLELYNLKPTAQKIMETEDHILRSCGLSNAKVKYVKDLSNKVILGTLNFRGISKKSDEQIIDELSKVKGVGVWTAQMFLISTLNRPNILPVTDLGIRKSIMLNYQLKNLPDEKTISDIAKKNNWHPYCTIVSLYLWASLDNN